MVTTTTVYLDENEEDLSSGTDRCSSDFNDKIKEFVNEKDMPIIKSTWEILKKDGNFAPKIFLR